MWMSRPNSVAEEGLFRGASRPAGPQFFQPAWTFWPLRYCVCSTERSDGGGVEKHVLLYYCIIVLLLYFFFFCCPSALLNGCVPAFRRKKKRLRERQRLILQPTNPFFFPTVTLTLNSSKSPLPPLRAVNARNASRGHLNGNLTFYPYEVAAAQTAQI